MCLAPPGKGTRTPGDNGGHDGVTAHAHAEPPGARGGVGVSLRHGLVLVLVTLAVGPACLVAFGHTHAQPREWSPPPPAAARATVSVPASVDDGCVERPLSYGLTDDQGVADQYARDFLSPLAPHPPLPRPGFYAPGRSPDQAALFHALYHGYVVVRYRPALATIVRRQLRGAVERAVRPVVLAAGEGMPFAAGAVVYGRTSICGRMNHAAIVQLSAWIEHVRPLP